MASGPRSCKTTSWVASARERWATASVWMSLYKSVPVSTTASPRAPAGRAAQAATESAERRACNASITSSGRAPARRAAGSGQVLTMRTSCGVSRLCQRCAVCQLPLLASASAGLTMTMRKGPTCALTACMTSLRPLPKTRRTSRVHRSRPGFVQSRLRAAILQNRPVAICRSFRCGCAHLWQIAARRRAS